MRHALKEASVRVTLTVLTSAVVVLVVLGQSFQTLVGESVTIQEELSLRARLTVLSAAAAISDGGAVEGGVDLGPIAERIRGRLDVRSLALVRPDGTVARHVGELPTESELRQVSHLRLRATPRSVWSLLREPLELAVTAPVVSGQRIEGYLLCRFQSREPTARLKALVWRTAWTVLFWVAVGGGLTLWVSRRLTQPLVELAAVLEDGTGQTYLVPADGEAPGEVGLVQRRLAEWSGRLAEERERVAALNAALRHQVEVVSANLEQALEVRETLLDSLPVGVVLLDASGRVTLANPVAQALLRLGQSDPTRPVWEHLRAPDAMRAAFSSSRALRRTQMVSAEIESAPPRAPTALRIRITPTTGGDADGETMVLIAEDISEARRLEEQMMRSERLASLGTLTAGLAHQVGNHLHAIKGYADLLARHHGDDDDAVEVIRSEVREAASLMDRVLLLARTRPVTSTPVHLPEVVRDALDFVRPRLRQLDVALEVRLPERGCECRGDSQLLTQAVLNLLLNAVQAMPDGGCLSVESRCLGGVCQLTIDDSGAGIPEALRSAVFDPFFTTKAEGEGTGLGLPIAQRIIELHGGTIELGESGSGGARFEIRIPTVEARLAGWSVGAGDGASP